MMMTLKEKVARARKLDKLTTEYTYYNEAAQKKSQFTEYYVNRAIAVGFMIDALKGEVT